MPLQYGAGARVRDCQFSNCLTGPEPLSPVELRVRNSGHSPKGLQSLFIIAVDNESIRNEQRKESCCARSLTIGESSPKELWRLQESKKRGHFVPPVSFCKRRIRIYLLNRFLNPMSPNKPEPRRSMVEGSGTGAALSARVRVMVPYTTADPGVVNQTFDKSIENWPVVPKL